MLTETTEVSEQQHFFGFFIRLQVQVDEIHGTSGKKKSYVVPAKNKKNIFFAGEKFQKKYF